MLKHKKNFFLIYEEKCLGPLNVRKTVYAKKLSERSTYYAFNRIKNTQTLN